MDNLVEPELVKADAEQRLRELLERRRRLAHGVRYDPELGDDLEDVDADILKCKEQAR